MFKLIGVLVPLAIIGCGQAAPESASSSAPAEQQAQLQSGAQRAPAEAESAAVAGAEAPSAVDPAFRCASDELPRNEQTKRASLVAESRPRPHALKPGVIPRLPLRPEVIEAPASQRALDAPDTQ